MNIFDMTTGFGVLLWSLVASICLLVLGLSASAVHRAFLSNLMDHRRETLRVDLQYSHDWQLIQQSSNET